MSIRMGEQLDLLAAIDRATTRRDLGIERVAAKAERKVSGWQASALAHLKVFLTHQGGEFLAEDFAKYATVLGGLEAPHDGRAFGSVMQSAARRGLIVKVGYCLALSSNMSPKCLWKGAAS